MRGLMIALAATPGLAACATTTTATDGSSADQAAAPMMCDAAAVQYHVGHDATQAMGTAILKESGARTLRWGPPNGAWTMDYRQDRVNVRYDDQMKITGITCG